MLNGDGEQLLGIVSLVRYLYVVHLQRIEDVQYSRMMDRGMRGHHFPYQLNGTGSSLQSSYIFLIIRACNSYHCALI
jgi:hypothetical protein